MKANRKEAAKIKKTNIALSAALLLSPLLAGEVQAAREQGPDWAKYQGYTVTRGRADDKFAFAQIGGYDNGYYNQNTYKTQVSSAIAQGMRAHTYIWYEVGGNSQLGVQVVNHFLPQIQTPKGSIVALDYEAGASGSKGCARPPPRRAKKGRPGERDGAFPGSERTIPRSGMVSAAGDRFVFCAARHPAGRDVIVWLTPGCRSAAWRRSARPAARSRSAKCAGPAPRSRPRPRRPAGLPRGKSRPHCR